jgi:hypothetical protein
MSADYRQSDLDEARALAPELNTKRQERIAAALAARERKSADRVAGECDLRLVHREVQGG